MKSEEGRPGVLARLKAAGIAPRRSLGQHFLHDPALLRTLVEAAGITEDTDVVEIGTGPGTLTRELAARARRVVTVEVDERLADFAARELRDFTNVEIVREDALETKSRLSPAVEARLRALEEFCWVSNLPYAVATPLIVVVLEAEFPWRRCVLTLQLEVAERLCAKPGDPPYGAVTLLVAFRARARILRRIGPGSFFPRPAVSSAAVVLEPVRPAPDAALYGAYRHWVRRLFGSPRKQIGTLLRAELGREGADRVLRATGWDPRRRPGSLGVPEFLTLAEDFPPF